MKFTILQQDLMPTLQSVARSCGVRSQLPVLGNILLQTDQRRLKLSATNLEIGVVKRIKADIQEDGEVTIPAKTLVEVVTNLSGEEISFISSNEQLMITTPTFSATLNGISATEFPVIPLTGKQTVVIDHQLLMKVLPQVAFAAATDEGRPTLVGILTEIKDKKLQLVATDGYRLAHKIIDVAEEGKFKAIVPRKTFEEVMRLISEEETDQVSISLSDDQNQIVFQIGQTQLSSRLIEGNFPAWEKIIPAQTVARIIVDRQDCLKAVKLASVFTRNEANVVKLHNVGSKLIFTSEAKELGSQKKEIEAQIEGEEITIAFNTKFLQDVLLAASSAQVIFELSGALSAAMVKPMGEEGLQYIVMPVNLS